MVKPLSSYPPEFAAVWETALNRELILTFATKGSATNLRQRLYSYRKRLQEQGLNPEYYTVDLKILQIDEDHWVLKAYIPEWKQQIRGLKLAEAAAIVQAKEVVPLPEPLAPPDPDNLSSTLGKLGFTTKE